MNITLDCATFITLARETALQHAADAIAYSDTAYDMTIEQVIAFRSVLSQFPFCATIVKDDVIETYAFIFSKDTESSYAILTECPDKTFHCMTAYDTFTAVASLFENYKTIHD